MTTSNATLRDQRGAMFLMGIPICFFMIGMLYFVIGIGEELILRERMQDAADAGALMAAVVHARAMNLIALLNQVMAAMVALLIMVRMLEVLLMAAIAIATALAYFTGGASMSIVPGAEAGREEAHNAWEGLKNVVEPVIEVIHALEVGIQYGMPGVAELRAVAVIPKYQPVAKLGFVIPGTYPLPVRNGTWKELCEKAGTAAGDMVTFPIRKLIPVQPVYDAIGGAMSALSGEFSQTFCGHGDDGSPTSKLTVPDQLPRVPLDKPVDKNVPALALASECSLPVSNNVPTTTPPTNKQGVPVKVDDQVRVARDQQLAEAKGKKDEVCEAAAEEQALARPNAYGEPLGTRGETCTYKWGREQRDVTCRQSTCAGPGEQACKPFQDKIDGAYKECKPGATPELTAWYFVQHDLTWVAKLIALPNCAPDAGACPYTIEFTKPKPDWTSSYVGNTSPPCGDKPRGFIGPEWRKGEYHPNPDDYTEAGYMCVEPHAQVEPSMLAAKGPMDLESWRKEFKIGEKDSGWTEIYEQLPLPPPPPPPPPDAGLPAPQPIVPQYQISFIGHWSAVAYLQSCTQTITKFSDSTDYTKQKNALDQSASAEVPAKDNTGAGSGGCSNGSSDNVHLTMDEKSKDNVLGGSVYQMRAIAIRNSTDSSAKEIVHSIPMRITGKTAENANPLGPLGDGLQRIFLAQAEYYIDSPYDPEKDPKANGKSKSGSSEPVDMVELDRGEWAWTMAWKARMRRVRILSNDDSDSDASQDSSQTSSPPKTVSGDCGGVSAPKFGNTQDALEEALGSIADKAGNAAAGAASGKGTDSNTESEDKNASVSLLQQLESLIIH